MADNEQIFVNKGYGRALFGRKVLYTDVTEITEKNVTEVISKVFPDHLVNVSDINYLYDYYKGKQPILDRITHSGVFFVWLQ